MHQTARNIAHCNETLTNALGHTGFLIVNDDECPWSSPELQYNRVQFPSPRLEGGLCPQVSSGLGTWHRDQELKGEGGEGILYMQGMTKTQNRTLTNTEGYITPVPYYTVSMCLWYKVKCRL